jgi:transcriptional regulator with XRE-family HTH domain
MSSPSSSAQQARRALGLRLREIRVNAGLTGRQLGGLMGRHSAKISRIEHGSAAPTPRDIREWCRHTGTADQVPDLLASLHAVEGMWVEWRRMERSGLRHAQESVRPLYDRTRQFRAYSPNLVPGIVQTPAYTMAVLNAIARRRRLTNDVDSAVEVRMQRQALLHTGDHRFALIMEESALRDGIGGVEVMAGQLGFLITVSSLPRVSLGIVPSRPDRDDAWPVEGFWMFDDEQVQVELVSGHLTITQPREISMYAQVFAELSELAVVGPGARSLLTAALLALDGAASRA